jgi:hypothetical protein
VIIDQVCVSIHGFLKRRKSGLCPLAAFDWVINMIINVIHKKMPPTNSVVA